MITAGNRLPTSAGTLRLVRVVAEGGMAAVYEAEHLGPAGFAKRIALKIIHPEFARDERWRRLFVEEAKLSANLLHANIVQIYQLGMARRRLYIAMEYISGLTLAALMERHRVLREPIPAALAAYLVSRVCRALHFAHHFTTADGRRLDIVHRDVCPANIMVTWDGQVKLLDFGIAKASNSIDPAANGAVVMGRRQYMSPEQLLGDPVDARSDLFALGAVLYEMLALDPLFAERSTELVIDAATTRLIESLRAPIAGAPREVERFLTLAVDPDPARRPTAATLGRSLERWCEGQGALATSDRVRRHLERLFPTRTVPAVASAAVQASRGTGSDAVSSVGRAMRLVGAGLFARILHG